MKLRLDKYLTEMGCGTRSQVKKEILKGSVSVNGEIAKKAERKVDTEKDEIIFKGEKIFYAGYEYFMLNKPQGYVCSTDDPDHPTVLYFLDEPVAYKLHAAGRLDIDTTGLVLMTDDGQWSHRITSPRHHCEKTYLVTLESPVADDTAEQFARGVQLHNEKDLTKPAVLEVITPTQVRLTISEGRYHQVKRMFAAVGNHVVELHRERIGDIRLDDDLEPGEYRPLTEEEIASVNLTPR